MSEPVKHAGPLNGLCGFSSCRTLTVNFLSSNRHSLCIDVVFKKLRPVSVEFDHASPNVTGRQLVIDQGQHFGELHPLRLIESEVVHPDLVDTDFAWTEQIKSHSQRL